MKTYPERTGGGCTAGYRTPSGAMKRMAELCTMAAPWHTRGPPGRRWHRQPWPPGVAGTGDRPQGGDESEAHCGLDGGPVRGLVTRKLGG
jgi:hypothetical protein